MTWDQFKSTVEGQGVKGTDHILSIHVEGYTIPVICRLNGNASRFVGIEDGEQIDIIKGLPGCKHEWTALDMGAVKCIHCNHTTEVIE